MPKSFAYPLGMLIAIILGTILFLNFCSVCQTGTHKTSQPTVKQEPEPLVLPPKPSSFPFSIPPVNINISDNFNFSKDSVNFITPIATSVKEGIDLLNSYLNANTNKTINISGFYTENEINSSGFENLGQARANAVKNYFVTHGIPAVQTNISGLVKPEMIPNENIFHGPIAYTIGEKDLNADERLGILHDELIKNPIVLYFETGQAAIDLSPDQRHKFTLLVKYLDKVENAVCKVVGHSDNTGSKGRNYVLGQQRADFVKKFLANNGIKASRIDAISFGQDAPIVPNTNDENKAKNRRTVITLK